MNIKGFFAMSMVTAFLPLFCRAQHKQPLLQDSAGLQAVNRHIRLLDNNGAVVIRSDAQSGAGVVWINDCRFSTGTIEADLKGKGVYQQSFVGIAFHGSNDSTYEAIYFRPFNFRTNDPVRKKHAVQYIALPKMDWPFLREKFPGQYENGLDDPPDPNAWFHARIVVTAKQIEVYVNQEKKPALSVQRLPGKGEGRIGLWLGNNSGGDFSNLSIMNH